MTQPTETLLSPSNIDAERHIIGALLLSPSYIQDYMLKLNKEDFYSNTYKSMYIAMCELSIDGKPVNPDTVAAILSTKKSSLGGTVLETIGGVQQIVKTLEGSDAGQDELNFWTDVVKRSAETRELINVLEKAKVDIAAGVFETPDKARNALEEKIITLGGASPSKSVSIQVAGGELSSILERYITDPDSISGLATGWGLFDRTTDGLQRGNVSIFYAPSSRFKSLFTANVCLKFAQNGHAGLWFTTEMPRVQVMERLVQLESQLNLKWLRQDREVFNHRKELYAAKERLENYPIYFCDTSTLDVSEVRAEVSRHVRWHGIEYVLVDLVDHIVSSRYRDEMVNNQRMVMQSMKQIAKDLDVHVILVSHVNKGSQGGNNYGSDLDPESMTGSASKYQDVDLAVSIMPVAYSEIDDSARPLDRNEIIGLVSNRNTIDVLIAINKNRHGELLRYKMTLDFPRGGIFYPKNREPSFVQRDFIGE